MIASFSRGLKFSLILLVLLNVAGISLYFMTGVGAFLAPLTFWLLLPLGLFRNARSGWAIPAYAITAFTLLVVGFALWKFTPRPPQELVTYSQTVGLYLLGLGAAAVFFGVIEFGFLRLFGLFRLGAITRVTYYEGLLQPFTLILLFVGIFAITACAFQPFFTINEDHKMYRDVAISLAFLFTLPVMIFASTKVVDEEIENRTMLTLMSKPIARWQVVLGKYFGVFLLCLAMITTLGIIAATCSYLRFFDDMRVDYQVAKSAAEVASLEYNNYQALRALPPAMLLQFMQIATLAAVSVAVSTRFGLALNVTVVVAIYMGANLARYAALLDLPGPLHGFLTVVAGILPGLGFLDLNQRLVYGNFNYGSDQWINLPSYGQIWQYVALAGTYAVMYIGAALSFGIALFRTRELT